MSDCTGCDDSGALCERKSFFSDKEEMCIMTTKGYCHDDSANNMEERWSSASTRVGTGTMASMDPHDDRKSVRFCFGFRKTMLDRMTSEQHHDDRSTDAWSERYDSMMSDDHIEEILSVDDAPATECEMTGGGAGAALRKLRKQIDPLLSAEEFVSMDGLVPDAGARPTCTTDMQVRLSSKTSSTEARTSRTSTLEPFSRRMSTRKSFSEFSDEVRSSSKTSAGPCSSTARLDGFSTGVRSSSETSSGARMALRRLGSCKRGSSASETSAGVGSSSLTSTEVRSLSKASATSSISTASSSSTASVVPKELLPTAPTMPKPKMMTSRPQHVARRLRQFTGT
mmetsp:Transcript_92401/g.198058  ORF Transcript_92401/g.198058 Transcript_92401/m.198058 type:complete len:340 (+) Transcript_92401:104-1123(+)